MHYEEKIVNTSKAVTTIFASLLESTITNPPKQVSS